MECSIFYEAVVKLEEWTSYPFLQYGHHFIEDKFYCDIHGTQRKHGGRPGMDPNIFVKSSPTAAQPVHIQDSPRAAYHPQVNTARPVSVSPAPSAGSKTVTTHYHTPKTQGILSPGQRGVPTAAFGADLSKSVTYGGGVGPGGTHYDSNRLSPAPSQYSTQSRNQSQQHYQQHVVQAPPPVPSNPPPSNVIEPAYDCYYPQVKFAGGVPVPVVMNLAEGATSASQFTIDFADMESKINEKTKMLVINNPHNPTGKLFSRHELEKLAEIAKKHNLIVIADEVYEFHVWDKNDMVRFASLPGMYERTISIGSAGKAFSVTGWKLGWAVGPKQLLEPLKAIHQNCVFTCSTPTQMAIAEAFRLDWPKFLSDPENSYLATGLSGELRAKRDKLAKMLEEGNFRPIIPDAGYFMLADYVHLKEGINLPTEEDPDDFVFSRWLCREKKLAVIPPSAFYSARDNKLKNSNMVRLCYFKKDETLDAAEEILKKLGKQ